MRPIFADMLLTVYTEAKLYNEAVKLYNLVRSEDNLPSFLNFNLFLECLVSLKQFNRTLDILTDAVDSVVWLDELSFTKTIESAIKLWDLCKGFCLMNHMKKCGLSPSRFVCNVLFSWLCKDRRVDDAYELFDEMLRRNIAQNRETYNSMIDGYCKMENIEGAFNIREKMKIENVMPNVVTYNTLLGGICKMGRMEEADRILQEMGMHGFVPDAFTYNILFDGHSRSGNVEASTALFEKAIKKGLQHLLLVPLNVGIRRGMVRVD